MSHSLVIDFGRYAGFTLGELFAQYKINNRQVVSYFDWCVGHEGGLQFRPQHQIKILVAIFKKEKSKLEEARLKYLRSLRGLESILGSEKIAREFEDKLNSEREDKEEATSSFSSTTGSASSSKSFEDRLIEALAEKLLNTKL